MASIAATGDKEMPIERPEVRVRPNSYQPRKAELEEVFTAPRKPDGSEFTIDEAARALFRPVTLVEDPEA